MRKILRYLVACAIFSSPSIINAQDWGPIGEFNGYANHMATDTINDWLYIAGGFNEVDGVPNQGLVKYDGYNISTINGASIDPFGDEFFYYSDIIVYQGELYATSPNVVEYGTIEGEPVNSNIMRYNGEQWESLFPDFGFCSGFSIIGDKLYLRSSFNDPSDHLLGIYDGENVEYITFQSNTLNVNEWEGVLNCGLNFNDQILFAGDINYTGWEDWKPEDILVFNPQDQTFDLFEHAPFIEFGGTGDYIKDLKVWNDQLIGIGNLNPGNNIWTLGVGILNDDYWQPIAGTGPIENYILNGMSPVEKALIIDEYCLVVGGYDTYLTPEGDYIPVSHVGYIHDSDFYALSSDVFIDPSDLDDIVLYHDTIFVAGAFQHINVYSATSVVKFNKPFPPDPFTNLSTDERRAFTLYPNPTTGEAFLNCPQCTEPVSIHILSLTGREVSSDNLGSGTSFRIDVSGLASGVYMVQLRFADGAVATSRLVCE